MHRGRTNSVHEFRVRFWSTELDGITNRFSALSIQNGIDLDGNANLLSVWLKPTASVVCKKLSLNRVKMRPDSLLGRASNSVSVLDDKANLTRLSSPVPERAFRSSTSCNSFSFPNIIKLINQHITVIEMGNDLQLPAHGEENLAQRADIDVRLALKL